MAREPDEIEAALLRRAEAAIGAAERVLARSEVVVGASVARRESGMTTRCAWCGRYRLGDRWAIITDAPDFVGMAPVTHGICEDCVVELRASGLSV